MTPKDCKNVIILTGMSLTLLFSSCGKDDDIPDPDPVPPLPTQGALQVTTDWSACLDACLLPSGYILRLGDTSQAVKDKVYDYPTLLDPGKYSLLAYNEADRVTVSGTTATIDVTADGTLEPLPGYLFSAATEISITAGDTLQATLKMQPHIRELTLKLALAAGDEYRILGTSATLSGIASAFSLADGAILSTSGASIVPVFSVIHRDKGRAAGDAFLSATVRIAGIVTGEKQELTLAVTLSDGTRQELEADLSDSLEDFGDEDTPLELEAELILPVHAGVTATIGGWKHADEYIEIEQGKKE